MARRDLTVDTISDLLWHNTTTGVVGYWDIQSGGNTWVELGVVTVEASVPTIGGRVSTQVTPTFIGTGQMDGDAAPELVWSAFVHGYSLLAGLSLNWSAAGYLDALPGATGVQSLEYNSRYGYYFTEGPGTAYLFESNENDFNGDGRTDLIQIINRSSFYHPAADLLRLYTSTTDGQYQAGALIDMTGWSVLAASNFSGSGPDDILIRNTTTGQTGYWTIGNGAPVGFTTLGTVGANQQLAGVGNFTIDATADVLWRDQNTGEVGFWDIQQGVAYWREVAFVGADWQIQETNDYTGDGISDILWRQRGTGIIGFWDIEAGGSVSGWTYLGTVSSDWQLI